MKVIFMGTPDFAVPALQCLIDSRHTVSLVITQPDRPAGRSGEPKPSAVKEAAVLAGIPVFQPERVRKEEALERIRTEAPDVIVVAAYGQILPQALLDIPPYGCVNIHASLLPRWRGAAPIQWAILNGDRETGVTIMQMDAGLDTGDILLQESCPIAKTETGGSLFDKLSAMGGPLLLRALDGLEEQAIVPQKQPETTTPYASMLKKEDGRIAWAEPAETIDCKVRGLSPWPAAFTMVNGKICRIWKGHPAAGDVAENSKNTAESSNITAESSKNTAAGQETNAHPAPGTVTAVSKDTVTVACGEGFYEIEELQLEGKKRMSTKDFLLGNAWKEGMVLGQ